MSRPALALIAAVARNGVIGDGNRLVWRLPSDLKRFRALTMGKPLIVGRKTWDSIGRPLPGRRVIVVTRGDARTEADIERVSSIETAVDLALDIAMKSGVDEAMIGGGAEIYRQTIERAQRLYITRVALAPGGDAHFPAIDPVLWEVVGRETPPADPRDEAAAEFVDYRRRAANSG